MDLQIIIEEDQQDQDIITIIEGIKHDATKWRTYSLKQGCLRCHGSIVSSKNLNIIVKLLREFHDSVLGGHSSFVRTYRQIKQHAWWSGMKEWIQSYVSSCIICQKNKTKCLKPVGLLQPLLIPDLIWDEISMDFIEGLPRSHNVNAIMVVVERLNKYAHFSRTKHSFIVVQIVQTFVKDMVKLHGISSAILSD